MAVYLVTWDLNKEKSGYANARTQLLSRLDKYESIKDSSLDSVRFVSTSWNVQQVVNDLLQYIDKNDSLFITKLEVDNYTGWLNKNTWDWIRVRL